jgi:carbonic anhydrase/acetyltransferase-like protein (isoleucine patch superfamily)
MADCSLTWPARSEGYLHFLSSIIHILMTKGDVYIEEEVSVLHHAAVHDPLYVGRNTCIGQHASIYGAIIGRNCVIMHGVVVTNQVTISKNLFVAPGQSVWKQEQADALPSVPDEFKNLNAIIVDHYYRLGKSYKKHTPLMI